MKVAADLVIRQGKEYLFIRRANEPFKGMLALPGGLVEEDETVEHAATRELKEETALRVREDQLRLIGVFSRIDRDPRLENAPIILASKWTLFSANCKSCFEWKHLSSRRAIGPHCLVSSRPFRSSDPCRWTGRRGA